MSVVICIRPIAAPGCHEDRPPVQLDVGGKRYVHCYDAAAWLVANGIVPTPHLPRIAGLLEPGEPQT